MKPVLFRWKIIKVFVLVFLIGKGDEATRFFSSSPLCSLAQGTLLCLKYRLLNIILLFQNLLKLTGYSLNCSLPLGLNISCYWKIPFQAVDFLDFAFRYLTYWLSSSFPIWFYSCLRCQLLLESIPWPWQPSMNSPIYGLLQSNLHLSCTAYYFHHFLLVYIFLSWTKAPRGQEAQY